MSWKNELKVRVKDDKKNQKEVKVSQLLCDKC